MRRTGVCPSVRPSVRLSRQLVAGKRLRRLPAIDRYLPAPEGSSGQRHTLRSEDQRTLVFTTGSVKNVKVAHTRLPSV